MFSIPSCIPLWFITFPKLYFEKISCKFSTDNFVINLSTEKPLQASKFFVDKFDVVMTNSKVFDLAVDAIKKGDKPTMVNKYGTIDLFPCKAQYMDNESCSTCRKCLEHNRKEVVIFKEH